MWSLCLAISVQLLLCSGWVKPVESQTGIVSQQVRHGLIPQRLESLYGSDMNGSCTLVNGSRTSCNGTSVLNDGEVPVLSGVSNDSESQWAAQLFTLRRPGMTRIVTSFELEDANHDHVELAVFNCPELGISAPEVNVYFDSSFRPARWDRGLGVSNTNVSLTDTSCDQLLVFCVKYNLGSSRYINLEFPFPSTNINSTFVFLGEVTFLNGNGAPCPPPKLVTEAHPTTSSAATSSTASPSTNSSMLAIIGGAIGAVAVMIILAVIVVLIIMCARKKCFKVDESMYDLPDYYARPQPPPVDDMLQTKENVAYDLPDDENMYHLPDYYARPQPPSVENMPSRLQTKENVAYDCIEFGNIEENSAYNVL